MQSVDDVATNLAAAAELVNEAAEAGADWISVHAEATAHLERVVSVIRESGGRPGVALNPGTSPDGLEYVLRNGDFVEINSTPQDKLQVLDIRRYAPGGESRGSKLSFDVRSGWLSFLGERKNGDLFMQVGDMVAITLFFEEAGPVKIKAEVTAH